MKHVRISITFTSVYFVCCAVACISFTIFCALFCLFFSVSHQMEFQPTALVGFFRSSAHICLHAMCTPACRRYSMLHENSTRTHFYWQRQIETEGQLNSRINSTLYAHDCTCACAVQDFPFIASIV